MDNNLANNTVEQIKHIINDCIEKKGQFVINAGCGTGKSTAISQLLESSECKILFLTDRNRGIEEVIKNNKNVYHFQSAINDDTPFNEKINNCYKFKHVAMTTQLFEILDVECKYGIYKDRVLIVDESIEFQRWVDLEQDKIRLDEVASKEKIGTKKGKLKFLNEISIIVKDFSDFTTTHFDLKKETEIKKIARKYKKRITKKIDRLLDTVESYELKGYLNNFKEFYNSFGIIQFNDREEIKTVMLKDYTKHYIHTDTTIILDGTAHLNVRYGHNNFKVMPLLNPELEIKNNKRLTINHINYNIGRTNFEKNREKRQFIDYLNERKDYDMYISSKNITEYLDNKYQKVSFYYGNSKGDNSARECNNLLIPNLPRLDVFSYIQQFFNYKPHYKELEEMKNGADLKHLARVDHMNRFENRVMNGIMEYEMRIELIQAINRCNIRNRQSNKPINIDMVFNSDMYPNMLQLLQRDFKGCKVISDDNIIDDFKIFTMISDDDKTKYTGTNIKLVVDYLETVANETDRKRISEKTGLNSGQIRDVFKNKAVDKYIKDNFIEVKSRPVRYVRK